MKIKIFSGVVLIVTSCALSVAFAQANPATMKAVVVHEFGGPEVLKYEDAPKPAPLAEVTAQPLAPPPGVRTAVAPPTRPLPQPAAAPASVAAAQFGSEGQKRTLAIALKMAQAQYLSAREGVPPILLIDDIMGELDVKRRSGLLPLLEHAHQSRGQVFMTATEENWPRELSREVQRWEVRDGTLSAA